VPVRITVDDKHGETLLRTLPVVHALRQVTEYPIIVMTNHTKFSDGTSVGSAFSKLNVDVWPIKPVDIPEEAFTKRYAAKCKDKCGYTFYKLQAWTFTQFDKIIMFDTDAIVTKNFDDLFKLPGTWAQEERWWCKPTGLMSGGFVILSPNQADYEGLIRFAKDGLAEDRIPAADQSTISGYFRASGGKSQLLEDHETQQLLGSRLSEARLSATISGFYNSSALHAEQEQKPGVKLIDMDSVDYGMCLEQHLTPPAFVHKSDRNNHCFTIAPSALAPDCMGHRLAILYRKHLCEVTATLGISFDHREKYC